MPEGVLGGGSYSRIDLSDLDIATVALALALEQQCIADRWQPVKASLDVPSPLREGSCDFLWIFSASALIDPLGVGSVI
jgi:hypothetical protein